MIGPFGKGHWTAGLSARGYGHLLVGRAYRVAAAFTDCDGDVHPEGESWTFLSTAFLPYEDGRSLFVSLDGQREWHIRLQDRPDQQGAVLGALETYLRPVNAG